MLQKKICIIYPIVIALIFNYEIKLYIYILRDILEDGIQLKIFKKERSVLPFSQPIRCRFAIGSQKNLSEYVIKKPN